MLDWLMIGLQYLGIILFVVFFFGFCVFIHELGHFLAAKWRGMHVIAFSIGFKKIWAFKYGDVEYRIGCIPCGGYVDLPQIDAVGQPKTEDGKLLPRAKPIDRIITAFAGPFFNVLFGFFLGTFIWIFGVPQDSPKMREIVVASVDKDSPEAKAGLKVDDVIYKVNGSSFYKTWSGFMKEIIFSIGNVTLDVKEGGKEKQIVYKPIENPNFLGRERIAIPFFKPKIPVVVYPAIGSAAKKAGLKNGDEIIELNGEAVSAADEFHNDVLFSDGKPMNLVVSRKAPKKNEFERLNITVIPVQVSKEPIYRVGIRLSPVIAQKIDQVAKNTPAEKAQLKDGDLVQSINGEKIVNIGDISNIINRKSNQGKELTFKIKRGESLLTKVIQPKETHLFDIGIQYAFTNYPTPWQQFTEVIDMTYKSIRGIIYGFMKKSTLKPSNMSGPLGIVHMIGKVVYMGSYMQGLYIIVVITFSLAIFNLLPLPVLDGGHIVIALMEMIIRRPLPAKVIQPVTMAFVVMLIGMMIYVSYNDILRLIPQQKAQRAAEKAMEEGVKPSKEVLPAPSVDTGKKQ